MNRSVSWVALKDRAHFGELRRCESAKNAKSVVEMWSVRVASGPLTVSTGDDRKAIVQVASARKFRCHPFALNTHISAKRS